MAGMPNIATFLKSEISRISRKEVRAATLALKKAASAHRSDIAALKRRAQALEQQVRRLARAGPKAAPAEGEAPSKVPRFSPRRLVSQRRRLGLSAADCGLLLGASAQSIYNWEEGKVRPRTKHLIAIAKLAELGKKDAAARLASLKKAG
ncbi:MAG: helix-turn-helix domain-containing protein [Caldimonas sp.]